MTRALASLLPDALRAAAPLRLGRVAEVAGLAVTVVGLDVAIGDLVVISGGRGQLLAEAVALTGRGAVCMPLGTAEGLSVGAPVVSTGAPLTVPLGEELLGRVLDGLGRPLDGTSLPFGLSREPVDGTAPHPLRRGLVDRPLSMGVRALDTLVTVGRGQRLGIFAGSGVGKSSLLSMIIRGTSAPVCVLALVGERGREVREFLENDLGPKGLARSVVVVATSDEPPMVRLRAAFTATRIAEHLRDQGNDVVLLMDSLTRVATAQREVGLSAGEPPATRGYPPSVFALLPRLLERAGPGVVGSITGLYTVLVEGDDHNEPIGDTARSILDGHVVLTRKLATAGHFPSIDVLESVSRVAPAVTSREQRDTATAVRRLLAAHREARDLIEIGAYVPGTNVEVDRARELMPALDGFLRQDRSESVGSTQAWRALQQIVRP
jgi:flagellum-specific ATP synthase